MWLRIHTHTHTHTHTQVPICFHAMLIMDIHTGFIAMKSMLPNYRCSLLLLLLLCLEKNYIQLQKYWHTDLLSLSILSIYTQSSSELALMMMVKEQ